MIWLCANLFWRIIHSLSNCVTAVAACLCVHSMRIIDDDIGLKTIGTPAGQESGESEDEAPTVAAVVDDRPDHVQRMEQYRKDQRWKVLGRDQPGGDGETETEREEPGQRERNRARERGTGPERERKGLGEREGGDGEREEPGQRERGRG